MRQVVVSMSMSMDGYIKGPDGRFDWSEPDPDVFALATDEVRGLSAHLLGRRLYEAATVPKMFVLVEGGSHHNTNSIGQVQYQAALNQLFKMKPASTQVAGESAPAI